MADTLITNTERTKNQVYYQSGIYDGLLYKDPNQNTGWGEKVRAMRRDPTIKLVHSAAIAPAMMTSWAVEADKGVPKKIVKWVEDKFFPHRTRIVKDALAGCISFGWHGFEKIFDQDDDGYFYVRKFKSLLQDMTEIMIYDNGAFAGFYQESNQALKSEFYEVEIPLEYSLLTNFDVEGTYHYGEAIMFAVEAAYDSKLLVNGAAERYDQKIAGAHWIVHYPIGESVVGGEKKDNYDIAMDILASLESSGRMAIPRQLNAMVTGLNRQGQDRLKDDWEIELITAYGSQVPFIDRMMYLDNLLVRAFGFPERSILQGQFGTKAEAGEHGTFALVNIQLRHEGIVEQLNWHCLNQLLRINFGAEYENKVRLTVAPLADNQQMMLKEIYRQIISNPQGFLAEVENINMRAVRDLLDIPSTNNKEKLEVEQPEPKPGPDKSKADLEETLLEDKNSDRGKDELTKEDDPQTTKEFSTIIKTLYEAIK